MILNNRNVDVYEELEIDTDVMNWINVTFADPDEEPPVREDGQPLTEEDRANWKWEVYINRPEYNIHHRETRHIDNNPKRKAEDGRSRSARNEGKDAEGVAVTENFTDNLYNEMEYEAVCALIRTALEKKPDWADMFIAVRIKDEKIRDYARRNGLSENNVTQKLERARRKLEKYFKNRKILHDLVANYRGTSSERRSSDEKQ